MPAASDLASWRACPRCGEALEHKDGSVRCAACGLSVYANPAPTASAIILDGGGRVLLARRAAEPGKGRWDLLGGFIDEGEDPLTALRRELAEEIGLEVEPGDFVGGFPDRYGEDGPPTLNFYWTAQLEGEPQPRLRPVAREARRRGLGAHQDAGDASLAAGAPAEPDVLPVPEAGRRARRR